MTRGATARVPVFDMAAEDYQRTRPVCPPELFDDLIDRAGLKAGDRVIEIGCGTGQATVAARPSAGSPSPLSNWAPNWQPSPATAWPPPSFVT